MSGSPWNARSPSSPIAGCSLPPAKASNSSRDSHTSMIPQPPSIGPAEWKISPGGGLPSTFMWPWIASYCSWVPPSNLSLRPTAIASPLSRGPRASLVPGSRRCMRIGASRPCALDPRDGLDVVPVRVEHEGAVVALRVLRAQGRGAVVGATGRERLLVEGLHLLHALGSERDVHRRADGIVGRDREGMLAAGVAELDLVRQHVARQGLGQTERGQRPFVEGPAARKVADPDREVIDRRTLCCHPSPMSTR